MPFRNKQLSQMEISAFCQQIAMVVNAGLPTYYGISILRDEAADEPTKALLSEIYTPMEGGATLYEALQATGQFPKYMVHMIELGETTGRLEEVLLSLSNYYEREAQIRDGIKKAATYPLIMTIMMIAVIMILIAKVLPVFSQVYEELGSDLTGLARTLMHISNLLYDCFCNSVSHFINRWTDPRSYRSWTHAFPSPETGYDDCSKSFCQLHVSCTCERIGYRQRSFTCKGACK